MALPPFIDVVVVTTKIDVDTTYRNGSESIRACVTEKQVFSDPSDPDQGDVTLSQAQIGVKTQGQTYQQITTWWGDNAHIMVLDDGSNFIFSATDEQGTETEFSTQAPILPLFSSSIRWV
jgi:hypothetical protein